LRRAVAALEAQRFAPVVAAEVLPVGAAAGMPASADGARRPSAAAWVGLAALAAALVGVFVLLPRYVTPAQAHRGARRGRGGDVERPACRAGATRSRTGRALSRRPMASTAPCSRSSRRRVPGVWGGATFAAAKSLGALATEAEGARDYALALDRIEVANQRLARVVEERPQALARQLREGEIVARRRSARAGATGLRACAAYRNPPMRRPVAGYHVQALGPVLPALVAAETASLTLDRLAALTRYEEVLRADPQNHVAREGAARARAAIGSDRYAREIGEALAAPRNGRTQAARAAIAKARALRPTGAGASYRSSRRSKPRARNATSTSCRLKSCCSSRAEKWADALLRYDTLLARDPDAGVCARRSQRVPYRAPNSRVVCEALLANPARLSAPEVRRQAGRLLADAGNIRADAPVLRGQADKLRTASATL
jgi:tetratricopeptide (TPR) repeat protein